MAWMTGGFAGLLLLVALMVMVVIQQQRRDDAVRHTFETDGQIWRLLSVMQDAETGQRGYILTGDRAFLGPYGTAADSADRTAARLSTLVGDNTDQLARVDRARTIIAEKFAETDRTIRLRDTGDGADAIRIVAEGRGKAIMDRLRAVLGEMLNAEAALLESRQAAAARVTWMVWATLILLGSLLPVLAGSAIREAARRASLSRFLPEELSSHLADSDQRFLRGRRQVASIAFVDIRGSTGLAESMDPTALSVFLTAFRRRIMRVARLHGGVVDKFLGDGALLIFGLPEPRPDDAARSLAFATDLVGVVARWNAARPGEPAVAIGVGIHYGEVFCGIIGEETRREFTVLGDTVNIASRLEAATKAHGVQILASEAAWRASGADHEGWREVSRAPLPGRREAIPYLTPAPTAAASRQGARMADAD